MVARFFKYDFWIPEQISDRNSKKYFFEKIFFRDEKFFEKHLKNIFSRFSEKYFWTRKNMF